MNERTIFVEALERESADRRTEFLDSACAGDTVLRQRVEALLASHEQATGFLAKLAPQLVAEELASGATCAATDDGTHAEHASPVELDFLAPANKAGSLGRLAHYDVQEVIGHGGMGIVLRAFDERLHRIVAIKVMAAPIATNAASRRRLLREARAAAAVCHDHIVTIHAVEDAQLASPLEGEELGARGLPYIVMQYIAGLSLEERIQRDGPLALHEILRIGMQTAAGLAAAHAQGLVHRDIKPANILLENGVERVKITDFGLATAAADASLSQSGIVAGTPQYMAPEQARGDVVDDRGDLFSLGSVLYAMCTGRAPFRAAHSLAVLKRVCEDAASPIREANPEIPDWLVAIIDKLHAKNPDDRFQSAAEVAELLGRYLAELQHPSMGQASRLPAVSKAGGTPTPGRHGWLVAAAALVLLLLGISLTEATGVTHVVPTVIRIVTGEGTLIVETDPDVQVTLAGNGDLTFKLAGGQSIRVPTGDYRVKATKDGLAVPVEKDLVTISRGREQIVRVRLDRKSGTLATPNVEKHAFVLLSAGTERKFDKLAEVVLAASEGGTIEVRGNGPFETSPITIRQPLVIRAADGYRPVIRLRAGETGHVLLSSAPLVLEGLEIQYRQEQLSGELLERDLQQRDGVVKCTNAMLTIANCRLIGDGKRSIVQAWVSPSARIVNSELLNSAWDAVSWNCSSSARLTLDNCILAAPGTGYLANTNRNNGPLEYSISISRCTSLMGGGTLGFGCALVPPESTEPGVPDSPRIAVKLAENVLDASHPVINLRATDAFMTAVYDLPGDQRNLFLPRLLEWREQYNLFRGGNEFCRWVMRNSEGRESRSYVSRDEWTAQFQLQDTHSREGVPRFKGGDLRARLAAAPLSLFPDDFRLSPDSPGYRAGLDGKDLGADVDLVGPGPAYEHWKKTPEYQEWLKETGQEK